MSENLTKKNHYVPQSYLRMFESDEAGKSLGVYNKELKRLLNFSTSSGQGFERFLYWNNTEGSDKNYYEDKLGKAETECGEIFKRLKSQDKSKLISLTHPEIYALSVLLSFQIFRTPEILSDLTRASKDMMAGALIYLEESKGLEHYEAIKSLIEKNDHKDVALSTMLTQTHNLITSTLHDFVYSISFTNSPLLTCDRPVIQLEDGGLIHSSTYYSSATEFIMPLSRDLVLAFIRKGSNSKKILNLSAEKVNEYIVRNASSRIYFHPEDTDYATDIINKTLENFKDEPIYKPLEFSGFSSGFRIKASDLSGDSETTIFEYETFSTPSFWMKTELRPILKSEVMKIYNRSKSIEKTVDSIMSSQKLTEKSRESTTEIVKEVIAELNDSEED